MSTTRNAAQRIAALEAEGMSTSDAQGVVMAKDNIAARLEYLRGELRAERISIGEVGSGVMSDAESIGRLIRPWLQSEESAFVILSEARGPAVVARVALGEGHRIGGRKALAVPLTEVLRPILALGAKRFVFAHDHSSGDTRPSVEDRELTRLLVEAAASCGLVLTDHIIVGPRSALSLVEAGILAGPPQIRYTQPIAAQKGTTA